MGVIKKIKHSSKVAGKKISKEKRSNLRTENANVKIKLRKRGSRSKKRLSKTRKQPERLDPTQVTKAVEALLLLGETSADKDSQLFGDEPQPILMQVSALKVPKTPKRRLRFKLPHPAITDTSDVCVFVSRLGHIYRNTQFRDKDALKENFQKYKNKGDFVELTENHYKKVFEKQGISPVPQVICLQRLLSEFTQFEEKRRLCQQFDVFLSDARIIEMVAKHMGKYLTHSLKAPIPVRIHSHNPKEEIAEALSKATMNVHGKGDSFIVQVGHTKQPVTDIVQNICFVGAGLAKEFPGGMDNVSAVNVKTPRSLSIPVYISMKSPNDIQSPTVKPVRSKTAGPVEGELTTRPGFTVRVLPSGKIFMIKDKVEDDDVEQSDKADVTEGHLDEEEKSETKLRKITGKDVVKGDDELEDAVATAEDSYLQQWKRRRDDENQKRQKKKELEVKQSERPKRKYVKYEPGEMCLGSIDNTISKKKKKSVSGGMARTALQELKSSVSKKKSVKKHNSSKKHFKSVICSNKSSKNQQKKNMKGKKQK